MSDQGGAPPAGGEGGGQPPAGEQTPAGGQPPAGGTPPAGGQPPAFALPDAYKDQPWAKDFKSHDDVFKSLANAQQFIGRPKFGAPGENATDAERAEFYKAIGVPEKPEDYEFKRPDNVPEDQWNSEHEKKWAGLMKQHNVPKATANALRDEMMKETLEGYANSSKELNAALDKAFGDKKQAISKEVGDLMAKAIPDRDLRAKVEAGIGNKNLPAFALAMGQAMQYMKKTYGLSDNNTGDDSGGSGKSISDMRAEATKLMATKAYTDTMHKEHAETRKTVDGLYSDIGRLTDAAKKK